MFAFGSRLAIGIAALAGAAAVATVYPYSPAPWFVVGVAAVLCSLGLACLLPARIATPFGRIVGAALFAGCLAYFIDEAAAGNWYDPDGTTDALSALMAMVMFGIPGAYFAFFGKWMDADDAEDGFGDAEDDLAIRPADSKVELEVAAQLFRDYATALGAGPDSPGVMEEARTLPGPYVPPRGALLIAWDGDDAAGIVALRDLGGGVAEMKRLFVDERFRGQGIGRELVLQCITEARARGYTTLKCDTLDSMPASLSLFPSLGFTRTERYWDHPNERAVFFELSLA